MPHDLGKNVVAFVHRANPGDGGVARSARFRISIEIETASKSQFCLAVQNVGVHPTSNVGTVVIMQQIDHEGGDADAILNGRVDTVRKRRSRLRAAGGALTIMRTMFDDDERLRLCALPTMADTTNK